MDIWSWLYALFGGGVIGLASSLLLLTNGRIAGISGILGGLFSNVKGDRLWRMAFLSGLVLGGLLVYSVAANKTMAAFSIGIERIIVAGLLVGIGTALGSGCTSGHGICGISRFSLRSIIATVTFMLTGFLTIYFGW